MQALKFNLSGKTAFFKKPDVNTYLYFTYGSIHKVAILGIIGAILGLKGYNSQGDDVYPEFYKQLSTLKISIQPMNERGYIPKKVQVFNNSVGYASYETGGNLIVKEQWLEKPSWDIYILLDSHPYTELIRDRLPNYRFSYIPYLGKNDHYANISNTSIVDLEDASHPNYINSLFLKQHFSLVNSELTLDDIENGYEEMWKYEERLPVALEESTNQYITDTFIFTNSKVIHNSGSKLYSTKNKVLFFF